MIPKLVYLHQCVSTPKSFTCKSLLTICRCKGPSYKNKGNKFFFLYGGEIVCWRIHITIWTITSDPKYKEFHLADFHFVVSYQIEIFINPPSFISLHHSMEDGARKTALNLIQISQIEMTLMILLVSKIKSFRSLFWFFASSLFQNVNSGKWWHLLTFTRAHNPTIFIPSLYNFLSWLLYSTFLCTFHLL